MSDAKFVAHCAECGHAYKVPSDTKVYPCKQCGGEVRADAPEEDLEDEPELEAEEEHAPLHRSIRERHPQSKAKKGPAIALLVVILLAAVGFGGMRLGWFGFLTGAERDFDKVAASFVEDWTAGDTDALAKDFHPTKQDTFAETLRAIVEHRGWQAGFPQILKEEHALTKGTPEEPELARIVLGLERADPVPGWASVDWQFEPSRDRWYMTSLLLLPTPLEARALAFKQAWESSDLDALVPFFRPKSSAKLVELLEDNGKKHGWLDKHPALGALVITGEDAARAVPSGLIRIVPAVGVYSEFSTSGKPLTPKWAFNPELDAWVVVGFKSIP